MSDAPLVFVEEQTPPADDKTTESWKILVVDDDQDVHSVTEFVMHGVSILSRHLSFLHAYNAEEARTILRKEPDIAVILLDVVMESEDAGLTLVRTVREELHYLATRIILRTGQPGYAPEYEAIRDFDINDYRTKSELSYARLLTSLTAAIRSYVQIKTIAENNRWLESVIQSAPELLSKTTIDSFAQALVHQLRTLISGDFDSFLFLVSPHPDSGENNTQTSVRLIMTSELYVEHQGKLWPIPDAPSGLAEIEEHLESCLRLKVTQFGPNWVTIFINGTMEKDLGLYIRAKAEIGEQQKKMLEAFSVIVSMGYQNMLLLNQLRTLAFQDNATGLLNRTGFIGAIDQTRGERRAAQAVALVDIEGFSEINEVLGHDFGDALLHAVAERLSNCFNEPVACGRVSADGFAMLGRDTLLTPDYIDSIFASPFQVGNHSMYLRIVCGLVKLSEVEGDGADMIKDAFIAVKLAKMRQQTRFHYYQTQFEVEARKKLDLLQELQRSLEKNALELHFQPQVKMETGEVTGLEALIRWKRKDGSNVPPSVFIPLAEQSGLIVQIGEWVLQQACRQVIEWGKKGIRPLRLAINISTRQFSNPTFLKFLGNILTHYGLSANLFELEITESIAMYDISTIIEILQQLKKMGFKIAIDDFGTGFSSLSYLQQLPIDRLKIDRSFITAIHDAPRNKEIAELIVGIGRSLDIAVIAEGVEVPEQAAILTALGCFEAQGYLFGKPMDAKSVTDWLVKHHS